MWFEIVQKMILTCYISSIFMTGTIKKCKFKTINTVYVEMNRTTKRQKHKPQKRNRVSKEERFTKVI